MNSVMPPRNVFEREVSAFQRNQCAPGTLSSIPRKSRYVGKLAGVLKNFAKHYKTGGADSLRRSSTKWCAEKLIKVSQTRSTGCITLDQAWV